MNLIDILNNSKNEGLLKRLNDLNKWSKLRHTKQDLELFLQFHVAQLNFKTLEGEDRTIICTSNSSLINVFNFKKDDKKAKEKLLGNATGIRTKDLNSINTYDLIDKKIKTIPLGYWFLVDFIELEKDNIIILSDILREALKK